MYPASRNFQKTLYSTFAAVLCFTIPAISYGEENLDELMARKARYNSNVWPATALENPGNHYTWQPESVMYTDVTTGHEVWILTHAPDIQEIFSKEHGTNAWSFDGSRVGFFSTQRPTANSSLGDYHWRWVVNTDGGGMRAVEGYGRRDMPFQGFGWANTENAYYSFGSDSAEAPGSAVYRLFKNRIDSNNRVSGSLVLDTSSVNTYKKDIVKDGVTSDDSWIVARDITDHTADTRCNAGTTREMYFMHLDGSPAVDHHWGIARGIGPTGDPYGNHSVSDERKWHDIWSPGPNPERIIGDYGSPSGLFVSMARSGSCADGGPVYQDWDGNSFGNDEIKVISDGSGTPDNPYNNPYFGHPAFDRWGKYAILGTYTDSPAPGTRIYNLETDQLEPNYVFNHNKYDGSHKSWNGWSDYVLSCESDWPTGNPNAYMIHANKWNADHTQAFAVVNPHRSGSTVNYNSNPRPSQSPDGTKVAFATYFLNNDGQSYPYVAWAVVHYPYAPAGLSATNSSGSVRLTWNRPAYTTRGWPNEQTDAPPKAREIKGYHVWASNNGDTGWTELTTGAIPTESFTVSQANSSVRYYAVTSEEHSRLESRKLSEIIRVTLGSDGAVTGTQKLAAGKTGFWTNAPQSPAGLAVTPGSRAGHNLISWSEPSDSKIRYYNIYYSGTATPAADQQHRIASVPVGTARFYDWLANPTASAYYKVTSVDRQGNESGGVGVVRLVPPPLRFQDE